MSRCGHIRYDMDECERFGRRGRRNHHHCRRNGMWLERFDDCDRFKHRGHCRRDFMRFERFGDCDRFDRWDRCERRNHCRRECGLFDRFFWVF